MYYLNKIVWFFLNPVVVPLVGMIVGAALMRRGRKPEANRAWRIGGVLLGLSIFLLWFESTTTCACLLGLPLERPYLATQKAETLPPADAIVILGGGIGKCEEMAYPDMTEGTDRIWHGARLWKAGKAQKVVVSGSNDLDAAVPLLLDFGVPRDAIVVDNKSRNTYENSRFTERLLLDARAQKDVEEPPSVLLVTSAWHMPRACGNFAKTSLKVIPAASDFAAFNACYGVQYPWHWIAPSSGSLNLSFTFFKEWLGKLARK